MIALKKETLEDSLSRIIWYYLNNDFNLHMVARELLSRECAALALQAGYSIDDFLKSGAYLLKNYVAVSFMPGSVNPLYMDVYKVMLESIDFEALAKRFFEESI